MTLSSSVAPAGSCDFAGRRTGALARGCARHPIPEFIHDPTGEASKVLPAIVPETGCVTSPVSTFPRAGIRRPGAFNRSQRGQSCQIIRASQHVSVSVSNFQVPSCWHEGGSLWRKVEPGSRQKNPRPKRQVM